jgi:hypothetical protein
MHFLPQSGPRDCFPSCFCNALRYFGVSITASLQKRLEIFNNGIESGTLFDSEERLELYGRSIHKFMAEWTWAVRCEADAEGIYTKPEAWAQELLKNGIGLELRNGPIEQQSLLMAQLSQGSIILCEVWIPRPDIPDAASRHFVLILGEEAGKLHVHDPLLNEDTLPYAFNKAVVKQSKYGANVVIDRDYFFGNWSGPLTPKPNPFQTDYEYKFLLVSKHSSAKSRI